MGWVLKFWSEGRVLREEFADRALLDARAAEVTAGGGCCVITPKYDEGRVKIAATDSGMLLGPARGARYLRITPPSRKR